MLKTAHWKCHRRQDTLLQGLTVLLNPTLHPRQLKAAPPISRPSPTSTQVHENCSPAGSATYLHADSFLKEPSRGPWHSHGNSTCPPTPAAWKHTNHPSSQCMGTATGTEKVFPATFQWKLLPGAGLPQHRTQATKSLQEGSDLLISTKSSSMITVLNILMSMNLCCKSNNTLTLLLRHFVFCGQPPPFPRDVNFPRSSFHATRDLKAPPTWQRPIRLS